MIIREIRRGDPDLQAFAEKHELFFHKSSWISCFDERLKQCVILNRNEELIGCFLYFDFRKAGFRFIITPPWTPDVSLFCVNPAESAVSRNSFVKDLVRAMSSYFSSQKASHISLNLPGETTDTQPFLWDGFNSRTRHTYILDLGQSEEDLKAGLSPEKRKSLSKAEKDGLQIKDCRDRDLLRRLVLQSLSRNEKNRNEQILSRILETNTGTNTAFAFAAWAGETPIAVSFCVINRQKALYLFGGYDSENKHHGAGVACMWKSILEARKRGLKHFDFEGSMDPRIERYFREFGGQLATYQCVEKTTLFVKFLMRLKGHRPL